MDELSYLFYIIFILIFYNHKNHIITIVDLPADRLVTVKKWNVFVLGITRLFLFFLLRAVGRV